MLALQLLSYHKRYHTRLRMISEVLTLRVEGGRVGHSWCLCVAGHVYAGLVVGRIEVVDAMHAVQSKGFGRISGDAGALPECVWHPITPSSKCARLGRVESELVGLPGNTGRYEKTPVCCPRSLLAALHGAARTQMLVSAVSLDCLLR